MTGALRRGAAGSRIALALAAVAGALASCAEPVTVGSAPPPPPVLTVSVHRSALLREFANPPLWVWTVDAALPVAEVEVSLDGGEHHRSLHPSARSFRPPSPLAPGRHRLTVRVTTSGVVTSTAAASVEARVDALPGTPPAPDDPCFASGADRARCGAGMAAGQWPLRHIRLPELWQALAEDVLSAPEPVVVAVLDTGYTRHPDLADNLDAAAGYDFVSARSSAADGDGIDPDAIDPGTAGSWHGTAIAGVIAAGTGNGIGVAGVSWPPGRSPITIMPVRVAGRGGATTYDVVQGLRYAAGLDNDSGRLPRTPARIINLSLAAPGPPDEVLEAALRAVTEAGSVVVAAAGNRRAAVGFPASSRHTLAVGSVAAHGALAATSNSGPEIDIVAPGGDGSGEIPVLGVGPGAGGSRWIVRPDQGTSIATAHVSGVLALLAGYHRSLTLSVARARLAASAIDLGPPGRDHRYGPGLLDAFALFGVGPGHGAVAADRPVRERAAAAGSPVSRGAGSAAGAPVSTEPHTLIVRYRNSRMNAADRATAGDLLRVRHALAAAGAGTGGYALVRLRAGQDRVRARAQLEADPAVASVHANRIYLPAARRAE
ncbi:MAG: S8 family serine peptidase [Spirochaetaceae bacterium]|nr:S8 family serine peptidase [Spirochaetaceae bacterium]